MANDSQQHVVAAEQTAEVVREVQAHSTEFRKELGLGDLVLTQILYVVGSAWVGTAALLGPSHVWFWLAAIVLFYLPQAAVVIYLNRQMPLEGGIYQWAKVGLGEFWGFLTAWNLWAYTVLILATFGVMVATNLKYFIGRSGESFTDSWAYTAIVSVTVIVAVSVVSVFGLRVSKWVQNAGGAAQFFTYAALIALPFLWWWNGLLSEYHPLETATPQRSVFTFNIFGKLALESAKRF